MPELNDEFIERMEDVLEVYARPHNSQEPVVCVDEKTVQLLDHTRPPESPAPGKVAKVDHEYERCGTVNIFACFEPKCGKPILQVTDRRTAHDFAFFLAFLASSYAGAKRIHLVMDNLNTHFEKSLIDTFGEKQGRAIWKRFVVHYTPKHASWLNQAELLLSAVSRAAIRNARYPTKRLLQKTLSAWRRKNKNFTTNWQFSIKDAKNVFEY